MPIEFQCPNCGQTLRTGDDTAGKKARCPKCQTVTDVPAVGAGGGGGGAGEDLFGGAGAGGGAPAGGQPSLGDFFSDQPQAPGQQPGANPYSAPQPESYSPFAGGTAQKPGGGVMTPTPVDVGACINRRIAKVSD